MMTTFAEKQANLSENPAVFQEILFLCGRCRQISDYISVVTIKGTML